MQESQGFIVWNAASPTAQKQKSPLAVPLHKFHQTDQNERIAFRVEIFFPSTQLGMNSHRRVQTHTSRKHKKPFNMPFWLHFRRVKIQYKSAGNYWFQQVCLFINSSWVQQNWKGTVWKRQRLRAVEAHTGTLALQDETCPTVYLYFSVLVIEAVQCKVLVVNGASEVTNHNTTPHPCKAAHSCRKQRCLTTVHASTARFIRHKAAQHQTWLVFCFDILLWYNEMY